MTALASSSTTASRGRSMSGRFSRRRSRGWRTPSVAAGDARGVRPDRFGSGARAGGGHRRRRADRCLRAGLRARPASRRTATVTARIDGLRVVRGHEPACRDGAGVASAAAIKGLDRRRRRGRGRAQQRLRGQAWAGPAVGGHRPGRPEDAAEMASGTNPTSVDTDTDGLTDPGELQLGTDPGGGGAGPSTAWASRQTRTAIQTWASREEGEGMPGFAEAGGRPEPTGLLRPRLLTPLVPRGPRCGDGDRPPGPARRPCSRGPPR